MDSHAGLVLRMLAIAVAAMTCLALSATAGAQTSVSAVTDSAVALSGVRAQIVSDYVGPL